MNAIRTEAVQTIGIEKKDSARATEPRGERRPAEVPAQAAPKKALPKAVKTEAHAPARVSPYTTLPFVLAVCFMLYAGWMAGREKLITAEEGIGYALGIIGGAMMLALMLYPLRKTLKFMRNLGAVKYWFMAHMVLGILGPVFVLLHSNYKLGSLNSTITLFVTLTVAISGVVGRYLYTRVHYGLYGRKATFKELKSMIESDGSALQEVFTYAPKIKARLAALDAAVLREGKGFLRSVVDFVTIGAMARWTSLVLRTGLKRAIESTAKRSGWSAIEKKRRSKEAAELIKRHVKMSIKTAEFGVYERMFSFWHVFHLPLFFFLVIVAVIHVISVHMY